ncbi:hypothetical protein [Arthrobacter sp. EpRS71]|uniref:hypothetical protein n=1 Tax=Arthrobacter sp. EpRS71 TaxID=1743141 RepID=UPI0007470C4D|nr:hypothetical protein [Arthrobacter sp. EpRS71]KUM38993.1 hypothetical protein AR689_07515 [Arthrobacter sp. EpRS71]
MQKPKQPSPYPSRRQVHGTYPQQSVQRFDPLLLQAMRRYQEHHLKEYGFKPSHSSMFATSILQHNDFVRKEYYKLKKEAPRHDKKHLDGIKTPKHPVYTENFDFI